MGMLMESEALVTNVDSVADALESGVLSNDPKSVIVAYASMDGECVDQHFGSAQGFYVYSINAERAVLLTYKNFPKELKDGNEDKLKPKLAWLAGCDMVYCGSVGGSATKQLIALGVNPVIVKEGPDVEELLEDLHGQLNGELPPMLDRLFKAKAPKADNRFDSMDDEGWDG